MKIMGSLRKTGTGFSEFNLSTFWRDIGQDQLTLDVKI